jgi:hypothetical protein
MGTRGRCDASNLFVRLARGSSLVLFSDKSSADWLLMANLFGVKSTAG